MAMHELRVVDITDSTVVAVDDNGNEFRLTLDESQVARLRSARHESSSAKVSPREIQALIRAGLSAADVSRVSGATPEDIERYEGPVIAEREFVLNSALATPTSLDVHDDPVPFGVHVRSRLESLGAEEQRWVSWKDPAEGWLVKVEFTAKGIDHDARWSFDARRGSLIPVNADAATLSQRGEMDSGLVPRLRAVDVMTGAIPTVNDSGAHTRRIPTSPVFSQVSESIKTGAINIIPSASGAPNMSADVISEARPVADPMSSPVVESSPDFDAMPAPMSARDEMLPTSLSSGSALDADERTSTPTADLLEALRKRRQQKDDAPSWLTDGRVESTYVPEEPVPSPISEDVLNAVAIEVTETYTLPDESDVDGEPLTETGKQRRARKTRPTLPAWDNIVFGRPADDSLG